MKLYKKDYPSRICLFLSEGATYMCGGGAATEKQRRIVERESDNVLRGELCVTAGPVPAGPVLRQSVGPR